MFLCLSIIFHFLCVHAEYSHDEFFHRYSIFKDNADFVKLHNDESGHSYGVSLNAFADLTPEEFKMKYLRTKPIKMSFLRGQNSAPLLGDIDLPASVDWTTKDNPLGKVSVNPIRDQDNCGFAIIFYALSLYEPDSDLLSSFFPLVSVPAGLSAQLPQLKVPVLLRTHFASFLNKNLLTVLMARAIQVVTEA